MELFPCQTCDTCYHASCMSPTLEPTEVPPFWFCPHCIDRDLHVPPPESPKTTSFSPAVEVAQVYPSPSSTSPEKAHSDTTSNAGLERKASQDFGAPLPRKATYKVLSAGLPKPVDSTPLNPLSKRQNLSTIDQVQFHAHTLKKSKAPMRQPKRSYSPPRKRSKYSALSSDVDKALSVIQKELETAANVGRSEENLKDRIQDLEQQLRLKDGQIMLAHRELELARNGNGQSGQLKAELAEMKKQNEVLKMQAEKKDAELRDWREKLKSMLGTEMGIA